MNALIKITTCGDFYRLRLITRHNRFTGSFYIDMQRLRTEYCRPDEKTFLFFDEDEGSVLKMYSSDFETVHCTLTNVYESSDSSIAGRRYRFAIPMEDIARLIINGSVTVLHKDETRRPRIECNADRAVRRCLQDKQKRTALRRAMRDSFNWIAPDSTIRLYDDGGCNIYFEELRKGERVINGGLVMTSTRNGGYKYEMHT